MTCSLRFVTDRHMPIRNDRFTSSTPIPKTHGYKVSVTNSHVSGENPCGVCVMMPVHSPMIQFHTHSAMEKNGP